MSAKGDIQNDHFSRGHYELQVPGVSVLTITGISGIEEELETVALPDRTWASGGHTKPLEFTIRMPTHHTAEQVFMEAWYKLAQEGAPLYKLVGSLRLKSVAETNSRSFSFIGLFPSKRGLPDLEMANEGDLVETTWTMKADDILPI